MNDPITPPQVLNDTEPQPLENNNNSNAVSKNTDIKSARLKNLVHWKPGQSGNPSGRRKGTVSLKARLLKLLTPDSADDIAKMLISMAKEGNLQAIKLTAEIASEISARPEVNIAVQNNLQAPQIPDDIMKRAIQYASKYGELEDAEEIE